MTDIMHTDKTTEVLSTPPKEADVRIVGGCVEDAFREADSLNDASQKIEPKESRTSIGTFVSPKSHPASAEHQKNAEQPTEQTAEQAVVQTPNEESKVDQMETKTEQSESNADPVASGQSPKTMDDLVAEIRGLKRECYVNRILFVLAMLFILGVLSFQIYCVKDILRTILEMFLAG